MVAFLSSCSFFSNNDKMTLTEEPLGEELSVYEVGESQKNYKNRDVKPRLAERVGFSYDSSAISYSARGELDDTIAWLKENSKAKKIHSRS